MGYDRFAVRSTTFEVGDRRRCRYNQLPRVAVLPILPGDPLFVPAALYHEVPSLPGRQGRGMCARGRYLKGLGVEAFRL
jgi:hypothetical protein